MIFQKGHIGISFGILLMIISSNSFAQEKIDQNEILDVLLQKTESNAKDKKGINACEIYCGVCCGGRHSIRGAFACTDDFGEEMTGICWGVFTNFAFCAAVWNECAQPSNPPAKVDGSVQGQSTSAVVSFGSDGGDSTTENLK